MRLCVLQPPNKSWQRKQSRNRSLGGRKRNQQSQSWQNALAAQVDTRIFLPTKKKKKAGLAEKVYSSTFYFFYLPAIQKHWIKMSFSITYFYYKRTKSLNTYYNFLLISQNLFAENEKTKSLSLSHIHFTLTL